MKFLDSTSIFEGLTKKQKVGLAEAEHLALLKNGDLVDHKSIMKSVDLKATKSFPLISSVFHGFSFADSFVTYPSFRLRAEAGRPPSQRSLKTRPLGNQIEQMETKRIQKRT